MQAYLNNTHWYCFFFKGENEHVMSQQGAVCTYTSVVRPSAVIQ